MVQPSDASGGNTRKTVATHGTGKRVTTSHKMMKGNQPKASKGNKNIWPLIMGQQRSSRKSGR